MNLVNEAWSNVIQHNLFYYVVVYSTFCVGILLKCNSCVLSVMFVSLSHSISGNLWGTS